MDNKSHTEAANALIQWFNSQSIRPDDSCAVMAKVIAKVLVGAVRGSHTYDARAAIHEGLDLFTLLLTHEINDRLHATRKGASDSK